ncbi:MAG TPA: Rieske (2Fe-2S) protein [Candidatus Acidoferrales bacterium]|nr:Rieske (2Fe-2S) protein [Candidatus Acidoferrales bacterium]
MSRLEPPRVSRRSFLSLASIGSFFAAMGVAMAGVLRLPRPTVMPGPVRRYKIGNPEDFPIGSETRLEKENVFIYRDGEGIYAISAVCTHLGCIVAPSAQGFACPCHGSKFDAKGNVIGGPAPRALPWLEVSRAADGQLLVLADNEVPAGTRFKT